MPGIVDIIADFTELRDQDNLESAIAAMLFRQLDGAALRLWRIVCHDAETWSRLAVELPPQTGAGAPPPELPPQLRDTDLRRSFHGRQTLRHPAGADGGAAYFFPVFSGKDLVNVLEVRTPLSRRQRELTEGLLRIYRNHRAVLDFSECDTLTGLLNRRTFGEFFKRIVTSSGARTVADERRAGAPAPLGHLAVIDIDFFKRINDRFGHPYGDEVLVLLARLMRQSFRRSDQLFRFGGEEFLVVLPQIDLTAAEQALERFRARIEAFHFSQVGRVTVSIGFTALRPADTGPDAFGRADQALYVSKHRGRNQVQGYELLVDKGALVPPEKQIREVELF